MKKILTTLAGTVALALVGTGCSAVDTTETKSIAPVVAPATTVNTPPVLNKNFTRFDYFGKPSRSTTRPVKPVSKPGPSLHLLHVQHVNHVVHVKNVKAAKAAKLAKAKAKKTAQFKKKVYKVEKKAYKPKLKKTKKLKNVKVRVNGIAACIAKYESGGNPRAQNRRSSASGLYQFIDGTWRAITGRSDRAKDAPVSVQTAAFYKLWNGGRGAGHWVVAHKCGY